MTLAILTASLACFLQLDDAKPPGGAVKEPELRQELLRRVEADQKARGDLIARMKEQEGTKPPGDGKTVKRHGITFDKKAFEAVKKADEENTKRLAEIVRKHGWPTVSLVGKDGTHAAWLLVQHADAEPGFQRKCLDLMNRLPKGESLSDDVAYLTDRVLLAEGKKQLYGTQFESVAGKWEPRPLEDPANVDKRRAEVGLLPLAEYVKQLESVYGKPKSR
ncbi:DUF6624 domain-containing protein [Aquisphaera insulae]|uniref:DUF6624 domain-containing protein n=1 Tax=Aquisphaera insulae TaxID=2712864 RepID=UPI0013ED7BAB|nr:DUF6624 domain-containing protein [Aquisphaera insulae]